MMTSVGIQKGASEPGKARVAPAYPVEAVGHGALRADPSPGGSLQTSLTELEDRNVHSCLKKLCTCRRDDGQKPTLRCVLE